MTSVNTNAAALTALRNLQSTVSQLDSTQNRISTGLKIGEAKDNAAYWAISTTLKSDNKSLSTVKDALGLGAATVDTAYQGLTKAKDVLDEIKSKLTAATQNGVDRDVIQGEIKELQNQLKSIATSSIFSGENWLSVNSEAVDFSSTKQVVSSFARAADNSVTIGTVKVDISKVSLYDSSTVAGAGGILNGAVNLKDSATGRDLTVGGTTVSTGNTLKGAIADTVVGGVSGGITAGTTPTTVAGSAATAGAYKATAAFGVTASGGTYTPFAGDKITLSINVDNAGAISVDVPGVGATPDIRAITVDNVITALTGSTAFAAVATATKDANGYLVITSKTTGTSSSVVTSAATATAGGGGSPTFTYTGYAAQGAGATGATGAAAVAAKNTTGAVVTLATAGLTATDKLAFDLTIDGASVKSTVTPGVQLGASTVNDANYQTALAAALNADSNFSAKATASIAANKLVITSNTSGATSAVVVNSVTITDTNGAAKNLTGTGLNNVATAAATTAATFSAVTLDKDDHIYFDVQVDTATSAKTITIDQALVNKTLSTTTTPVTNGAITTAADYAKVVNAALKAANVTTATASAASGAVTITSNSSGTASKLIISNSAASQGGSTVTVDTLDISAAGFAKTGVTTDTQIKQVLQAYISVVNQAITKVTTAASNLGSVASRIDMQKTFVNTLMDTIDKGVGNLVDADMSEESTKLQALQVKQQLGVQALSIANQSAQNIISLFRS